MANPGGSNSLRGGLCLFAGGGGFWTGTDNGSRFGELPIDQRILRASGEVQRSLTFSTAIMVCAFLPLFTMAGPEGQIFGPMAETYAFALGGALLLAPILSPVLCDLLLPKPQASARQLAGASLAKELPPAVATLP